MSQKVKDQTVCFATAVNSGRAFSHASSIGLSNKDVASAKKESNTL